MKLFNEYTSKELLELTNKQIDDLAKLELVKDGQPLPYIKPQVETLESIDADHLTIYEVSLNKKFLRKEDAQRLIDAIEGAVYVRATYGNGGYIHHVDDANPEPDIYAPDITTKKVYKTEDVSHIRCILEKNATIQEKIDKWQKVMDKFYDARGKITSAIWEASKEQSEKEEQATYMEECMRLADNDKIIATRFFEKRYPNENKPESHDF